MIRIRDKHITMPWQVKCDIFSAVYFKEFYHWVNDRVLIEVEGRVQDLRLRVRDHVWEKIDA
jgi:hypothetical protein